MDQRVSETRVDNLDRVDRAFEVLLHHVLNDDFDLVERSAITNLKICHDVAAGAGDELRALASYDGVFRGTLDLRDDLEEVGVEWSGQTFVRSDENDPAGLDRSFG